MKNSQVGFAGQSVAGKSNADGGGKNRVAGSIRSLSRFCYMGVKWTRQAGLCAALFLFSLLTPTVSLDAGDIFITGHPIFARGGNEGLDKVVMDYLRDGIPIPSYEIAVIGSGVAGPNSGGQPFSFPFSGVPSGGAYMDYDWSPDAKAVGYDVNTTYYKTDDLISGTADWCDVLSKDCLVILSYEGPHFSTNTGDLSDSGVAEIFANRTDIICAFNAGMDLLVLGGGDSPDYYDFLGASAISPPLFQPSVSYGPGPLTGLLAMGYGPSPTVAGCQIGIENDNVDSGTCTPCPATLPCGAGMMLEESLQINHFGPIGTHLASSSTLLTVMTTHDIDMNGSRYLPDLNEPADVVVSLGAKSIQLPVPPGPSNCGLCPCVNSPQVCFDKVTGDPVNVGTTALQGQISSYIALNPGNNSQQTQLGPAAVNTVFGDSIAFNVPNNCSVVGATLDIEIDWSSLPGSGNDRINLIDPGVGNIVWSRSLWSLFPSMGVHSLSLDLSALPLFNTSTKDILSSLQDGEIDLYIQDESGVLSYEFCYVLCCKPAPPAPPQFRRGDSNIDAQVDIGDAIHIIQSIIFSAPLECLDASDSNDDESVDLSDVLFILMGLYGPGAPPPAPGPINCGPDTTGNGALDCQNYSGC